MCDKFAKLTALIKELPIDTEYEQGLMAAATGGEKGTCLIAGAQDADPFMLLPMEERLFEMGEVPPYAVTAEYAGEFSICAVNKQNQREIYRTVEDFRAYCGGRQEEISECILQMPGQLLSKYSLRFAVMDNISMEELNRVGRGCNGCVIAAEADAGALSDDYMTLCGWLANDRHIGDKTALVLNRRTDYSNDDMLSIMAATMLGQEEIPVFAYDSRGDFDPKEVLTDALGAIMGGGAAAGEEAVLRSCCDKVEAKLSGLIEKTRAEQADCIKYKAAYEKALQNFTAMADMEKYSLNSLLENHEVEAIRNEIHGMFASLKEELPKLMQEAETKSGTGAREDIRQLIGDYIGDLVNGFMECLLNQVAAEQLLPRTEKRFKGLCDRFGSLMKENKLEQEDDITYALAEFLKIININIGTNHAEAVEMITEAVQALVKFISIELLQKYQLLNYGSARFVGKQIDRLFVKVRDMVNGVMVWKLKKDMIEHLEEQEKKLCDQLDTNMLPRLYAFLQQEYAKLTEVYKNQLKNKAEGFDAQQKDAAKRIEALQQSVKDVAAICGA